MSTPSVVKLVHALENHQHEVCSNNSTEHFHEFEIDCEFYKFNKVNPYHFSDSQPILFYISEFKDDTSGYYSYLNSHRQLYFSLRGPPAVLV